MNVNQVTLIGNVISDIELKATQNGHSVCSFSLATNRDVKKGEQWEKMATFHNIVAWGHQAEFISKYSGKGRQVCVLGRIETRSWEAQDGTKRYKTEIVAEKVFPTGNKGGNTGTQNNTYSTPSNNAKPKIEEEISIEDIPF